MNGFALLWGKILDSSIWVKESKETRLVWITLLAMKNSEGKIWSSVIGLAHRAKVSQEECKTALHILLSPDPDDTSKVEEGRRIREIPGGWEVINHDLYRFSTEAKREFWRVQKAEQRKKTTGKKKRRTRTVLPGELAGVRALESGDEQAADRIMEASLPDAAKPDVPPE